MARSTLGKTLFIGIAATVAGATFSLIFPNTVNYAFLPGMMVVYVVSGGVHGYDSGVYLPRLPLWYALGGFVDVAIYAGLAFAVLRALSRRKGKGTL